MPRLNAALMCGARLRRWLRRKPWQALALVLAVALAAYVVIAPLQAARYPLMTDLPFHAANASVFAHHSDASFHFREQFELQPFAVPYMSMYALAALLMPWVGMLTAVKIAAAVMLAQLPIGLAVLFHGMRKSPLLGLWGLVLVWGGLTHWGFLNFVAAVGMFALVLGATLRLLDKPSRAWSWVLGVGLVAVFFTHPFRFPFAVAAVVGTGLLMGLWGRQRWTAVAWTLGRALLPAALLFAVWWLSRPDVLAGDMEALEFHWERLLLIPQFLYNSLHDRRELPLFVRALTLFAVSAGSCLLIRQLTAARVVAEDRRFGRIAVAAVLCCVTVFVAMYLVLPMQIGLWWYVFPREITTAALVALALHPDLPRGGLYRPAAIAVIAAACLPLAWLTTKHNRAFKEATADFARISEQLPQAPKLLYLVFDHSGSRARATPFIHLPAYIQAERGGWLSFHFASFGASPVIYRSEHAVGAVVPPATPKRWEWQPQLFSVQQHGAFFDWFLVRRRNDPSRLFSKDPSIELAAQEGSWWLFQRRK